MKTFRRRTVLKGLGGLTLGLPFLEAMRPMFPMSRSRGKTGPCARPTAVDNPSSASCRSGGIGRRARFRI